MKPNNVNKKFLEEQVRLMLNEVGPQDVGAGSFDPEGVDDLNKTMKSGVAGAKKVKDLFRELMIGTEKEIEDLGTQLSAKWRQYNFEILDIFRTLQNPAGQINRVLISSPEFVMEEVEHFAAIQKKQKEFRLALRLLTTDIGDFSDKNVGQGETLDFTSRMLEPDMGADRKRMTSGLRTNAKVEAAIHGLIQDIARVFGIDYSLPPNPEYKLYKGFRFGKSTYTKIVNGDEEELTTAREHMISATKSTLKSLGFSDLYQSSYIDSKFFDASKWPEISGDEAVSMIQMYVLSCIPELEDIYDKYGSTEKFPWTGNDQKYNVVAAALLSGVKDKYHPEDVDALDKHYQKLLTKSLERVKEIYIQGENARGVVIETLKNIIQFRVGAEMITKGLGLTGIKNFLLNVSIDVLADYGIYELMNWWRSRSKSYRDFSQGISDLYDLTIMYHEDQSTETLTEIDKTIDAVRKLSYQIVEVQEREFAKEALKIIKNKNAKLERKPGALNQLDDSAKQLEAFLRGVDNASIENIRISPNGKPVGASYNIDCESICNNTQEISWYNSKDPSDKKKLMSWLGELAKLSKIQAESGVDHPLRTGNFNNEIEDKAKELAAFIQKMKKEKKEDEESVDQFNHDDGFVYENTINEGPLDTVDTALSAVVPGYDTAKKVVGGLVDLGKTGFTAAATMAAFYTVDKAKEFVAPKDISNAKNVHEVRQYLIAHFNLLFEKLTLIDDISKLYGDKPSAEYINKKQEYLTKNIFNSYYAKWKNMRLLPKAAAWIHRPLYIVDISTRYLKKYDSHRISMAFDVVAHPTAAANKLVAIREDRRELFYKTAYNSASYARLVSAIDETAKIVATAAAILEQRMKQADPKTNSVDGVKTEVVEQFHNFVKLFSFYFIEASKALKDHSMPPVLRAWHMDRLGQVMEVLRG
jgi:hypothetical protein